MGLDELNRLYRQRNDLSQRITQMNGTISTLEDKISRLSKAKTDLTESISNLTDSKSDIDDFEVSQAKWKGETERNFIGKYNSYGIMLQSYKLKVEDAKELIEEALETAKDDKITATATLTNYETMASNLDARIEVAREDV